MGRVAKVSEFEQPRLRIAKPASWEPKENRLERLIPGSDAGAQGKKKASYLPSAESPDAWNRQLGICKRIVCQLLPGSLKLVQPTMLAGVLADLVAIGASLWITARFFHQHQASIDASFQAFYLLLFFFFAIQDGIYAAPWLDFVTAQLAVVKAIVWTTILAGLAFKCASPNAGLLPLLCASGFTVCFLTLARRLFSMLPFATTRRNVLAIGNSRLGTVITNAIRRDSCSERYVKTCLPEEYLRDMDGVMALSRIARKECIDEILLLSRDAKITAQAVEVARRSRLDLTILPTFDSNEPIAVEDVGGLSLLKVHRQPLPDWKLAAKRVLDLLVASAALVVFSPLLLLIATVIKFDRSGPVLYRAARIGQRGQLFTCYKFRTMIAQADAQKAGLRSRNERDGAFFKIWHDPRIMPTGRFLRRYSLDELPQLWNVLLGNMSLVGPRPHPPDDVEHYQIEHMQRLDFVPGITGLWQVTARQDPSFERSVALDVEYIKRWSPALDLRILCKTVPTMLRGSGA